MTTVLAQTTDDYLPVLTLYIEEEIMGEGYFDALRDRAVAPRRRRALHLLARIEAQVVDDMAVLVQRHGLTLRDRDTLLTLGVADAETPTFDDWGEFIEHILTVFPTYNDAFAALEAVAPKPDLPCLKPFIEHEDAAIRFAQRERDGDRNSLDELTSFLNDPV